jgi:hypothetical protein
VVEILTESQKEELSREYQRGYRAGCKADAALRAEGRLAVERLTDVANLREGQNERLRARVAELEEALRGFMEPKYSLGASHPHFSAYVAYDKEVWERGRRALEGEKRGETG